MISYRNSIVIFLMVLLQPVFAQRTGYRIKRFTTGTTYSQILIDDRPSGFSWGYHAGFTKSFPVLLYKIHRHNDKPLVYLNGGLTLNRTGGKGNQSLTLDTSQFTDFDAALTYLNVPLSAELNFYQNRFKGFILNAENSFLSIEAGMQFSYLLYSKMIYEGHSSDLKKFTNKYDIQWFLGARALQTLHGLSLDFKYVKGLKPVYISDLDSRQGLYLVTLSWNRMESRCANSHRKMKRTLKTLRKIGY